MAENTPIKPDSEPLTAPTPEKATPALSKDTQPIVSLIDNRGFWSKAMNVIAYPVGAIAAYYTSDTMIRRSLYSNFAKPKFFSDLQKMQNNEKTKLLEAAVLDNTINVVPEIVKIDEKYLLDVRHRVVNEWNIKGGKWDYWKMMHRNQKIETAIYSFTAAAITIGAMLSISDHLGNVKDIIFKKENKLPGQPDESITR